MSNARAPMAKPMAKFLVRSEEKNRIGGLPFSSTVAKLNIIGRLPSHEYACCEWVYVTAPLQVTIGTKDRGHGPLNAGSGAFR